MKKDIRSLNLSELKADFEEMNEKGFRAGQVYKWIASGCESFDDMSNISKPLREKLNELYFIPNVKILRKLTSQLDGTVKYLYELYDGEKIESVLMKYNHGYTVCISTQVGCRMGCSFCASGIGGLCRNLLPSEMLAQVMMAGVDNGVRISNIVLMGMGEPLDNFDNVKRFLELVSDPEGLGIGYRHISLSTSGVVPGIYKLAELNYPITLSISLHASTDEKRGEIMPINKKWNISELLDACVYYYTKTGRRISFEYTLIAGKNDSDADARELGRLLKGAFRGTGAPIPVNLIRVNAVKESGFSEGSVEGANAFCKVLCDMGITATVRRRLGADVNAACGQLRRSVIAKEENT